MRPQPCAWAAVAWWPPRRGAAWAGRGRGSPAGRGCRQGPRLPPRWLCVPRARKHLEQLQEKQNPSFCWFPTWLLRFSSGLEVDAMLSRNRGQGWGGWGGCRRASQFPGAADTQGQLGGRHRVDAGSCIGERKGTFALAARSWDCSLGETHLWVAGCGVRTHGVHLLSLGHAVLHVTGWHWLREQNRSASSFVLWRLSDIKANIHWIWKLRSLGDTCCDQQRWGPTRAVLMKT